MTGYDPKRTVSDFALRTRKNLEFVESHVGREEVEVYEVTQLINSLLGLLVFPQQKYIETIPETPLAELEQRGMPRIRMTVGASKCETLRQLVRYLRNSIAHFNVEFKNDESFEIAGLVVWNKNPRGYINWKAYLPIDDVRSIIEIFLDILEIERMSKTEVQPGNK